MKNTLKMPIAQTALENIRLTAGFETALQDNGSLIVVLIRIISEQNISQN